MGRNDIVKSASLMLAVLAVVGLSACGGGSSGSGRPSAPGDEVVITPPSTVADLVVGSASVSDSTPDAGASFTLRATVRNAGDGRSAMTTLRYYRSSDATISASDTAVGTDAVSALSASGTSAESISLTAPSSAGTYYYGACVDTVSGESNTANNCSGGVRIVVSGRDDHSDSRSGATSLSLGSSRSGQIESSGDVDYFRVQVGVSGTLKAHTTGTLDTVGELQSSSGATIESDNDSGTGGNFTIERSVSPGAYFIKVSAYGSDTGSYTLHAEIGRGGGGGGGVCVEVNDIIELGEGESCTITQALVGKYSLNRVSVRAGDMATCSGGRVRLSFFNARSISLNGLTIRCR